MRNKKDKILIGVAITIILIVIGVIIAFMPKNKPNENTIIDIPQEDIKMAEFLITTDKNGLNLVSTDGKTLDTIEGEIQFVLNDKNDTFIYEKENVLYKAYVIETKKDEVISYELMESKVYTSDVEIDKFTFNDKYIALLTKTKFEPKLETEKASKSTLNSQITNNVDLTYYTLTLINKETLTKTEYTDLIIDEFALSKDCFIYSCDNMLYSLNLTTNETSEIYLGKNVQDLINYKDKLIVFNSFGKANDSSLILKIDDSLKIEKASNTTSSNVFAIRTTEDTESITFMEYKDQPTLYLLNLDGDRESKQKSKLSFDGDKLTFNTDNTIYTNGYVYTSQVGKTFIINVKTAKVEKDLNIDTTSIYPILDSTSIIVTEVPSEEIILNTEVLDETVEETTEIESTENE